MKPNIILKKDGSFVIKQYLETVIINKVGERYVVSAPKDRYTSFSALELLGIQIGYLCRRCGINIDNTDISEFIQERYIVISKDDLDALKKANQKKENDNIALNKKIVELQKEVKSFGIKTLIRKWLKR